jgi:hypothetical protein
VEAILNGIYDPISIFFAVLLGAAFVVEAWALVDAIRRPTGAFPAAGKQTKQIWLIILGVATALGFAFFYLDGITSFLAVAAFVAAAIYHVDVRPKIKEFSNNRNGGGTSYGPYGPW